MASLERINQAITEALSLLIRPMPPEPDTETETETETETDPEQCDDAPDHDPDR